MHTVLFRPTTRRAVLAMCVCLFAPQLTRAQQAASPPVPISVQSEVAGGDTQDAASPASAVGPARQQEPPSSTPSHYGERQFVKDLLPDEKAIWTSPFRVDGGDAKWLVPFAVGTAALIATDDDVIENMSFPHGRVTVSRYISYLGSTATLASEAGALYFVGRLTHNDHAKETGLLSAAALSLVIIVNHRPGRYSGY